MCERRFSVKPASQRSFVSGMELADDLLHKLSHTCSDPGGHAGTGNPQGRFVLFAAALEARA